jgi:hypothetical protein
MLSGFMDVIVARPQCTSNRAPGSPTTCVSNNGKSGCERNRPAKAVVGTGPATSVTFCFGFVGWVATHPTQLQGNLMRLKIRYPGAPQANEKQGQCGPWELQPQ